MPRVDTTPRRRKFLHLSISIFVLAMLVFSVWLGSYVFSVQRQKGIILAIEALGGEVWYDYQVTEDPVNSPGESHVPPWMLRLFGHDWFHHAGLVSFPVSDNRGVQLAGQLSELRELYLWGASRVTDAGIRRLDGLHMLQVVSLREAQIGDDSLGTFGRLPNLKDLTVEGGNFTDEGLRHLGAAVRLESIAIDMNNDEITDDGLAHLSRLKKLEFLLLMETQITNSGADHLKQLPNLRELYLDIHQIDDRETFQKKLPNCLVEI